MLLRDECLGNLFGDELHFFHEKSYGMVVLVALEREVNLEVLLYSLYTDTSMFNLYRNFKNVRRVYPHKLVMGNTPLEAPIKG